MTSLFRRMFLAIGLTGLFNLVWFVNIRGKRIRFPIVKRTGLVHLALSEMWMVDLLTVLLKKKSGIFIDVGVNLGQTLIKLKVVDPSMVYLGFEPNPLCVSYVRDLIKINDFKNCTLVPSGLSAKNDLLILSTFGASETDSMASVVSDFRPDHPVYAKQYVPVICFDEFASEFNFSEVAIIKIDVEGGELEVIQGMRSTIATYRPIIMVEVLPAYSEDNTVRVSRQRNLETIFSDLDYKLLRVQKSADNLFSGLEAINDFGIHSDLEQCDYVIAPAELFEGIHAETTREAVS